jgi:subtilisin family serine protease
VPRYFIAQRLATSTEPEPPLEDRPSFTPEKFTMRAAFLADTGGAAPRSLSPTDTQVVELATREAAAKQAEMPSDVILEEEKLRSHDLLHPMAQQAATNTQLPPGVGAAVELLVTLDGQPIEAAVAMLSLQSLRGWMETMSLATTGPDGKAELLYDPRMWRPNAVTVAPRSRAWGGYRPVTSSRMTLPLMALPRSGPLAWWHHSLGIGRFSADLGSGIRVGVIDTGIGPHPYLAHAKRAGAIIGGQLDASENATNDVAEHGTHVAGIIGARPSDPKDYAGIAAGAELVALRVYPGGGTAGAQSGFTNNGDIAQAITRLSRDEECDIINLSSSGPLPSEIEIDRITAAFNQGTLVVCSAGNGGGPPVLYPAAIPFVVGVSAMGILNTTPQMAVDIFGMPMFSDRYSMTGAYLAAFSSFGPEIKCIAPGVGIISTVPTSDNSQPAYMAASGTSMAAPIVAGTLAALLSRDSTYKSLPRGRERAVRAWSVLAGTFRSLGLFFPYQGFGLPTILSA